MATLSSENSQAKTFVTTFFHTPFLLSEFYLFYFQVNHTIMVAYECHRKEVSLSRDENTVVSFDNGIQFLVKHMESELWQVENEEGNFSIMWIRNNGNLLIDHLLM